jgi:hypothetical protein
MKSELLKPQARVSSAFSRATSALALFASTLSLASAQSCSVPLAMPTINVPVHIDTCTSTYIPSTFCGGISPTGPAVVFNLDIAYPNSATTLQVLPDDSSYDAAFVIESTQCSELSICPYAIDGAGRGAIEQLNLGGIDSGRYFLVVTSFAGSQTCGGANVTLSNPENIPTDGIFRSGGNY